MEVFKKIIKNYKKYGHEKCEMCSKQYTDIPNEEYMWCKSCRIIKKEITNWTSGNEKIDNLIQEKQSNLNEIIVFEWIPYDRFNNINEIGKGDLTTIYSALWKDGPLYYSSYLNNWARDPYLKVTLKYLYDSPNIVNKFLNEVCTGTS